MCSASANRLMVSCARPFVLQNPTGRFHGFHNAGRAGRRLHRTFDLAGKKTHLSWPSSEQGRHTG